MKALRRVTVATAIGLVGFLGAGHEASAQIKIGSVLSVSGPASFLAIPKRRPWKSTSRRSMRKAA